MPEGPEVKRMAYKLSRLMTNKKLLTVNILSGRYKIHEPPKNYSSFISELPSKVSKVFVKGKFIYVLFENNFYMWNTLGMTGKWSTKKNKYSHVEFIFKNTKIYFNDIRNFGTLRFSFNPKSIQHKLTIIGPDILELDTNEKYLLSRLQNIKTDKPIGELLLHQNLISGIGNYLRADILWYAKLSPYRKLKSLTNKNWTTLYNSIIQLAWFNYDFEKGLKLKKFKNIEFFKKYINIDFFIYQRDSDIYGNEVVRETLRLRTIHWCPKYQL
jgi:DNA-formamidopyrimidine glycosylase